MTLTTTECVLGAMTLTTTECVLSAITLTKTECVFGVMTFTTTACFKITCYNLVNLPSKQGIMCMLLVGDVYTESALNIIDTSDSSKDQRSCWKHQQVVS